MNRQGQEGFSLMELLISILIFLIITTISFSLLTTTIRVSKNELTIAYRDEAVKSAFALMTAEIEQAGAHPDTRLPPSTLLNDLSAGADVEIRLLAGAGAPLRGINVGDMVSLHSPTDYDEDTEVQVVDEEVEVLSIDLQRGSFRANLTRQHPKNSLVVNLCYPYRTGILPNSTATKLRFYGDIFDDGRLYYVEYTYDDPNDRLLRAVRLVDGNPPTSSTTRIDFEDRTLLRNVLNNPNGVPTFQYVTDDQGNIVSVIITVTTGTGDFNNQRPFTLTTTVTARNIAAASTLLRVNDAAPADLPETPAWIKFISTPPPDGQGR
ncbi:MAG: prepilin-type N-terminal cleavage/methylation domain-containing protein [Acidobacteriota bacterium]